MIKAWWSEFVGSKNSDWYKKKMAKKMYDRMLGKKETNRFIPNVPPR